MTESEYTRYVEVECGIEVAEVSEVYGGKRILSEQDHLLIKNADIKNEHELIVVFTPALCAVCTDAGLEFVNSEEEKWIHTQFDHADNYQKPDGCSTIPNLYIRGNVHRYDILRTLREEYNADYRFGKGIWAIRDMYKVWEYKIKVVPADKGKAYSYAVHLSRGDRYTTYFVILCDAVDLYIVSAKDAVVMTVQKTTWSTAGSRELLMKTLNTKSKWHELLDKCCEELHVSVVGFLGAGAFGRCFEVVDGSGKRFALKVVLTVHQGGRTLENGTLQEYRLLLSDKLSEVPHVVRVANDSFRWLSWFDVSLGVCYLMTQVGMPLEQESCKHHDTFRKVLAALIKIHSCKVCHGDARCANAIMLDGTVLWIDFMAATLTDERNPKKYLHEDVVKLVGSVFGSDKVNSFKQIPYDSTEEYINAVMQVCCPK
eukprot:CAMPEP_0181333594 /NCGR_PEP_ID=MMETSP1101-20121128/25766_1 /TAXON_ID=46948 /ORGANISM="Rhodomonas abbreviata, Strain Caron Lab Isolate" /LENGTH=427 /DNA_ID=CAMNT_0023443427 /DNA_START=42 /DNA_END=1325 /DNA_ORIENTATION=+